MRALASMVLIAAAAHSTAGTASPQRKPTTALPPVTSSSERQQDDDAAPARPVRVDLETLRRERVLLGLDEALADVPGVQSRNRYNQAQDSQINVRGYGARSAFGVRGVRVEYAGIPATAADGQSQIGHIDLQSASRVEVIRGPFAALYGNGGAVIRIDGPLAGNNSGGRIETAAGSNERTRLAVSAGGGEDLRWHLAGSRVSGAGARRQSEFERVLASVSAEYRIDERSALQWHLQRQDQPDSGDPQGLTRAEFERDRRAASPAALLFGTRKSVLQDQLGVRYFRDGERSSMALSAYAGERQIDQILSISPQAQQQPGSGGGIVDLDRGYSGVGIDASRRFDLGDGALTLSTQWRADRLREERRGFENFVGTQLGVRGALRRDESNRAQQQDAIARLDYDPTPRLRLSAGLRRNRVDYRSQDRYIAPGNPDDSGRFDSRGWVPVVGVRQSLGTQFEWHASAGKALEVPTLAELAYRADGDGGFNSDLQAASARQGEVGVRGRVGALRLDASVYTTDSRNEIVVQSASGGRTSFQNAARTRRRGLELAWDWPLAENWSLRGHGNWMVAEYRSGFAACASQPCSNPVPVAAVGQRLPGVSPRFGRLELVWQPRPQTALALEWQGYAATPASDRFRGERVPGYGTLGLRSSWTVDRRGILPQRLLLRVDNLLDHRYSASLIVNEGARRYFEPAPGRSVWLGLHWRWQ